MYLGRFQLGQTVHLPLACCDANEVAVLPDQPPWLSVLDASGNRVQTGEVPIRDRYQVTGLFHLPLFLGAAFATGRHTVVLSWLTGSFSGLTTLEFEVTAGGDKDGAVTAMYFFRRPQADFAVYATESGKIAKGRNPQV